MSSVGVSVYALSIMNKQTKEQMNLNDINGENLIDIFINFMDYNNQSYTNEKSMEKIFKTEDYEDNIYKQDNLELFRYSIGRLKTGAYGYSAEIVDANTGDINYNRGIADAEVMPFFSIYLFQLQILIEQYYYLKPRVYMELKPYLISAFRNT